MLTHLERHWWLGALLAFDGLLTITIVLAAVIRFSFVSTVSLFLSFPFHFLSLFFFSVRSLSSFSSLFFFFFFFPFLPYVLLPRLFYTHLPLRCCMYVYVCVCRVRRRSSIGLGRGSRRAPAPQLLGVTIRDVTALTAVCATHFLGCCSRIYWLKLTEVSVIPGSRSGVPVSRFPYLASSSSSGSNVGLWKGTENQCQIPVNIN